MTEKGADYDAKPAKKRAAPLKKQPGNFVKLSQFCVPRAVSPDVPLVEADEDGIPLDEL